MYIMSKIASGTDLPSFIKRSLSDSKIGSHTDLPECIEKSYSDSDKRVFELDQYSDLLSKYNDDGEFIDFINHIKRYNEYLKSQLKNCMGLNRKMRENKKSNRAKYDWNIAELNVKKDIKQRKLDKLNNELSVLRGLLKTKYDNIPEYNRDIFLSKLSSISKTESKR